MRAAFHTLGCKVNSYETQAVKEQFAQRGFDIADFTDEADVYVINTCSVTSVAEHKSRQMLHRARRLNPDAIIVATGCFAQRDAAELEKDAGIDLIVGNNRKSEIADIVINLINERKSAAMQEGGACEDAASLEGKDGPKRQAERGCSTYMAELSGHCGYEMQSITSAGGNSRAYVKIQDGCNRFCSYCIIPYLRGRSRCRDEESVAGEVMQLASCGYKEIVLTGIDISMYKDLAHLAGRLSDIKGIERIRLGSLEAGVITSDFIREIKEYPKVCPHFHLSLQSGCDATLKRMNRHYTAAEFAEKVYEIREAFDLCGITTDIIVGFPKENDEEFEQSLEFAKKMRFSKVHVFKYSRREGTAADRMDGQISENVKNERSAVMIREMSRMQNEFRHSLCGLTRPVLIEECMQKDGAYIQTGLTPEYVKVRIRNDKPLINAIVPVKLVGSEDTAGSGLRDLSEGIPADDTDDAVFGILQ